MNALRKRHIRVRKMRSLKSDSTRSKKARREAKARREPYPYWDTLGMLDFEQQIVDEMFGR